ncbi:MAG: hypothetical protein Q9195_006857 [Heterodermia aff. obscurata]
MASMTSDEEFERSHVHEVYDQIAPHFSSTRYKLTLVKPWPIVERFLLGLSDGSVGLDVGCGNGKYLTVNPNIFVVASDRSEKLVRIAQQHQPHTSIVADTLSLPHSPSSLDFAISIAVVHHLSTSARRGQAIAAILEVLRPPPSHGHSAGVDVNRAGKALIYVWALEQKHSRRGWDEGDDQDVMVPWVMKQNNAANGASEKTFNRYYHLYRRGELEEDIQAAGGEVVESGYEKDNWWAIAVRRSTK